MAKVKANKGEVSRTAQNRDGSALNGSASHSHWLSGRRSTFRGGVHPPEQKELTAGKPIRRFPFAGEFVLPLAQHAGAPSEPIVRQGQEVVRGEPLARPAGFVSVPVHSPVTGRVIRIGLERVGTGGMGQAIVVRPYSGASQDVLYGAPLDIEALSPDALIQAVQNTGVVGLGGAAFPTHVKIKVPEGKAVDTIILNGCECEPYLTTDHRVMLEQINSILDGARIIQRAMGAERIIIGVESNKPDAIKALRNTIPSDRPVTVEEVGTKYPQGAEKMLIEALLDREVPSGGLPIDVGVGVFNVATVAQIGELLPRQQGLIERVVTVTGPGVKRPGNYLMALGTPLRFVLEQVGLREKIAEIIFGGPMMGPPVSSLDVPVTKGITGIVVLTEDQVSTREYPIFPCIRCSRCVEACPVHLNPSELGLLGRKGRYEEMVDDFHLMDCFECGSCAYVCPSNIPLVQYFRVAKGIVRERRSAK